MVKVCGQGLYAELKKRVEQEIANLTDKHLEALVQLKTHVHTTVMHEWCLCCICAGNWKYKIKAILETQTSS